MEMRDDNYLLLDSANDGRSLPFALDSTMSRGKTELGLDARKGYLMARNNCGAVFHDRAPKVEDVFVSRLACVLVYSG